MLQIIIVFLADKLSSFLLFFLSEILRAIDSLQLTEKKRVATPADWKVSDINLNPIYQHSLIFVLPDRDTKLQCLGGLF
jgi:hypothetical protein